MRDGRSRAGVLGDVLGDVVGLVRLAREREVVLAVRDDDDAASGGLVCDLHPLRAAEPVETSVGPPRTGQSVNGATTGGLTNRPQRRVTTWLGVGLRIGVLAALVTTVAALRLVQPAVDTQDGVYRNMFFRYAIDGPVDWYVGHNAGGTVTQFSESEVDRWAVRAAAGDRSAARGRVIAFEHWLRRSIPDLHDARSVAELTKAIATALPLERARRIGRRPQVTVFGEPALRLTGRRDGRFLDLVIVVRDTHLFAFEASTMSRRRLAPVRAARDRMLAHLTVLPKPVAAPRPQPLPP